jgi:hypothetical protein
MINSLFVALAMLLGALAYIMTMDVILSSVWLLCCLAFFGFWLPVRLRKYHAINERNHEMFHFINAFVIALSVKKTPSAALDIIKGQMSTSLRQTVEELETSDTFLILDHLKPYFRSASYDMFLTIIDLYVNQGGSIISMSSLLLATLRIRETEIEEQVMIAKRKLTNFVILWVLTIVVILFSRFGISFLFEAMIEAPIYKMGIMAYFFFMLYSVFVWTSRYMVGASDV